MRTSLPYCPSATHPILTVAAFLQFSHLIIREATGILQTDNQPLWAKCVTRRTDKILLTCPLGHVIYRPVFVAGAIAEGESSSSSRTCKISDDDCRGELMDMESQVNKCYWRRSCKLTWREQAHIMTSSNVSCIGRVPDYVMFSNAPCLPPSNIVNMCDTPDAVTIDFGVVRSHDSYPGPSIARTMDRQQCTKILSPKENHTLVLHVDDVNVSSCDVIEIRHVTTSGEENLKRSVSAGDVTFTVTSGKVVITYVTGGMGCRDGTGRGFVLRFEQKNHTHQDSDLTRGEAAGLVAAFGESELDVKAAISRCLANNEEEMTLNCPADHVIFEPEVTTGVVGWERRCHGEFGDCEGQTHTLVVQTHQCFWQQSCRLSWRRGVPILKAKDPMCMIQKPDYIKMADALCVPKDAVTNLCDRSYWNVNGTQLFVRSHDMYPWNYGPRPAVCRKRIRVHRKYGLRIVSRNLDLAPNGKKDNLKLWRVTEKNGRTLVKTYYGNDVIDEGFETGCVDLEFRRGHDSNGAAGFVLELNTLSPVTENTDDFYDCGNLVEAVRVQRASRRKRRRLKRLRKMKCLDGDPKTGSITTEEFEKMSERKGYTYKCRKGGVLSNVTVIGHNKTCRGLSPEIFAKTLSCHWETSCTLKYVKQPMLKVFDSDHVGDCVHAIPDHFTFKFECTKRSKVKVLELSDKANQRPEKVSSGILRSHSFHPWLYKRDGSITLRRAKKNKPLFVYTLRTLSLWKDDSLVVNWTDSAGQSGQDRYSNTDDEMITVAIPDAQEVTFRLDSGPATNGGDGFTVCFKWDKSKYANKPKDPCKSLLVEGKLCKK